MYKHIIILSLTSILVGCQESSDSNNQDDTSSEFVDDSGEINIDGLPEGTECNQSGLCTFECAAEDCHNGVDIGDAVMITANCCREAGDDVVCENTSWYIRGSDGLIVADCEEDELCQLIFQI